MTAKSLYQNLTTNRTAALQRARDAAALTIPALLPPMGATDATVLPTPFQSIGAEGVNNLSSKIMLALFPPGVPFVRLVVPDQVAKEAGEQLGEIQKRLATLEGRILDKFETTAVRPRLSEVVSHLIVAGNALAFFPKANDFRMFRIDQYVIRRDAGGNPIDAVVKECVHPSTLAEPIREFCGVDESKDKTVEIYTQVEWRNDTVNYWQEINDKEVPNSRGHAPIDKSPWMPLRWKAVPGQDYGRGHVEEYLGALNSLEGLSQAIVEFSAVAAKIIFLVHPNSSTDMEDVNAAQSGEAVSGAKVDIDTLQLDKYADFQVAEKVVSRLEQQLARAFLLRSAMTRDAERVTAEEIRAVAQELEDVLGGVYTVQANELQLPFVKRQMALMQRKGELPPWPKGSVDPVIISGFQALGRNQSLNRLRGFIQDFTAMLGPQAAQEYLDGSELGNRLGAAWGVVDLDSLVRSADAVQQMRAAQAQAAMQGNIIDKAAGPVAKVAAENMKQ